MDEPKKTTGDEQQPAEDVSAAEERPTAAGAEVSAEDQAAQGLPDDAMSTDESAPSESPSESMGSPVDDARGDGDVDSDDEVAAEEEPAVPRRGPIEEVAEDDDEISLDWYILKVQSNRENTICDALRRRVSVAGLDRFFGDIMVPTEDIVEFKNGKKKIVKRKLYPGYIVAHMAINDDTWFLVRETPGIGDFTGSQGKPSPMLKHEVDRIVRSANPDEEGGEQIKTAIPFKLGDRVRIKEGTFENFEGDVEGIDEANGRVTVMINIFGRSTPFEAEHWQIESV